MLQGLLISFLYNATLYDLRTPVISVPLLLPNVDYTFSTIVNVSISSGTLTYIFFIFSRLWYGELSTAGTGGLPGGVFLILALYPLTFGGPFIQCLLEQSMAGSITVLVALPPAAGQCAVLCSRLLYDN